MSLAVKLSVAVVFLLGSCTHPPPYTPSFETASKYTMHEAGIRVQTRSIGNLYWPDDETVIFLGHEENDFSDYSALNLNNTTHIPHLYLWKVGTRPMVISERIRRNDWYCAVDGKTFLEKSYKRASRESKYPPYNCIIDINSDANNASTTYSPIPKANYSLVYSQIINNKLYLKHNDSGTIINLPIINSGGIKTRLIYSVFNLSYSIWQVAADNAHSGSSATRQECVPYWIVSAVDGRISANCIPFGDWAGSGRIKILPSRIGDLILASPGDDMQFRGNGLYLVTPEGADKILAGHPVEAAVSPGGCRLAIQYSPRPSAGFDDKPGKPTMLMLNLCEGTSTSAASGGGAKGGGEAIDELYQGIVESGQRMIRRGTVPTKDAYDFWTASLRLAQQIVEEKYACARCDSYRANLVEFAFRGADDLLKGGNYKQAEHLYKVIIGIHQDGKFDAIRMRAGEAAQKVRNARDRAGEN